MGVASQGINSLSNLLATIAIARVTTPSEYGAWALGYTAYALSLHFTRATASTPLILAGDADDRSERAAVAGGVAVAVMTGLIASAILGAIAAVSGFRQPLTSALVVFAVVTPVLLVNDVLRNVFFRNATPGLAVIMDVIWILVQLLGAVALTVNQTMNLVSGTLSWALGALLAAAFGMVILRVWPSPRSFADFVRRQRSVGTRLVADSLLVAGSTYMVPVAVAGLTGLAGAGALRAGQTLMGGINILLMGLQPVLTLESRRALKRNVTAATIIWRWSLAIGIASILYGVLLVAIPDSVGRELVGQSWGGASQILLPLTLLACARGPQTAGPILMKAAMDLNGLLLLRAQTAVPAIVCPLLGTVLGGFVGAAWGLFVGAVVIDVMCVHFVSRRSRAWDSDEGTSGQPTPST